jgi:hypothetical protein
VGPKEKQTVERSAMVPAARLELARLAAADFESATSTDFVTRAGAAINGQQTINCW